MGLRGRQDGGGEEGKYMRVGRRGTWGLGRRWVGEGRREGGRVKAWGGERERYRSCYEVVVGIFF